MVNSVVLVGRIATDPEMRYTQSGTAVTNFRIAVDRRGRRGDDQGQGAQQPEADFLDVVTWREQAEFVGTYLKKGALIAVEGRLQARTWEAQDGTRRRQVEVVASRVQALESRAQREQREAAGGTAAPPAPASAASHPQPAYPSAPAAPAPTAPPAARAPAASVAPPAPPQEQFRPDDAVGGALPRPFTPSAAPDDEAPPYDDDIFNDQ